HSSGPDSASGVAQSSGSTYQSTAGSSQPSHSRPRGSSSTGTESQVWPPPIPVSTTGSLARGATISLSAAWNTTHRSGGSSTPGGHRSGEQTAGDVAISVRAGWARPSSLISAV